VQSERLAPEVYGACGRMVVVEHGGRMLETFINASFVERADLALQLIALMKKLWVTNLRIEDYFTMLRVYDIEALISVCSLLKTYMFD